MINSVSTAYAETNQYWLDHSSWYAEYMEAYNQYDDEKALQIVEKELAAHPDNDMAWVEKGNTLTDLGRYPEAIEAYNKAIGINASSYIAWDNKAHTLFLMSGHRTEALAACEKAIAINPQDDYAWTVKGLVLLNQREYSKSIEANEKAIALSPDNYHAWSNKGEALYLMGDYSGAAAAFDQALAIEPADEYSQKGKEKALAAEANNSNSQGGNKPSSTVTRGSGSLCCGAVLLPLLLVGTVAIGFSRNRGKVSK